jgi:hypothetical protein
MTSSKSEADVVIDHSPQHSHGESSIPSAESDGGIASEAIGTGNLPPGYYRSLRFVMTMVAIALMNISLYLGYVLPVRNELLMCEDDTHTSRSMYCPSSTKTSV